jgi:hypothetical protein
MVELTIFVAGAMLLGAVIAKLFEWRQDVLYGPYVARNDDRHDTGRHQLNGDLT